jgi:hypothetical protein
MSKKKKEHNYTDTYNPSTNKVTRLDTVSGETWEYFPRPKIVAEEYMAKNGVTVDSLIAAGNKVRVKHLRYALYMGLNEKLVNKKRRDYELREIVVPSTFRKDPMYTLLPKGGYTHVVIQHSSGKYVCVSSACSKEEPFCYARGVATALDRLSKFEMSVLGV